MRLSFNYFFFFRNTYILYYCCSLIILFLSRIHTHVHAHSHHLSLSRILCCFLHLYRALPCFVHVGVNHFEGDTLFAHSISGTLGNNLSHIWENLSDLRYVRRARLSHGTPGGVDPERATKDSWLFRSARARWLSESTRRTVKKNQQEETRTWETYG